MHSWLLLRDYNPRVASNHVLCLVEKVWVNCSSRGAKVKDGWRWREGERGIDRGGGRS